MADPQKKRVVLIGVAAAAVLALGLMILVVPGGREASAQEGVPPGAPGAPPAAGAPPGTPAPTGAPPAPAAAKAPAEEPKLAEQPMEPSRPNPFLPVQGRAAGGAADYGTATKYGPDFSNFPVTMRLPFPRPETPKPEEAKIEELKVPEYRRLTAVLWSPDGGVTAVLEVGEPPNVSSKIVKPGDVFDNWQVIEIQNDRVILRNRSTGKLDTVELKTEKEAPRPRRTQPRTQPGAGPAGAPAMP